MRPPRLLIGAGLIFWGSQTQFFWLSIVMAIGCESAPYVKIRWPLERKEFHRVGDLCTIFFLIICSFYAVNVQDKLLVFAIMEWLPLIFYPLLVVQVYSQLEALPISSLFYSLRKAKAGSTDQYNIQFGYFYFGICIFASAVAFSFGPWFYAVLCILVIWALWPLRAKHNSPFYWLSLMMVVMVLGFAGHVELRVLHTKLDEYFVEFWLDYFGARQDPYRSMTSIGQIGELKLSDEILFRVDSPHAGSLLLREVSYNRFGRSAWFARNTSFVPVTISMDNADWQFSKTHANHRSLTILKNLDSEGELLPLPVGAETVGNLPVQVLHRNGLGTVKASDGPGFVRYKVNYAQDHSWEDAPNRHDFAVPELYRQELLETVRRLNLNANTPRKSMEAIANFFTMNYRYTTYQSETKIRGNALKNFLRSDRSGHCEYFATATVLLLRQVGIPARYVTGYAVQEFSPWEQRYIVRARHAHAWASVYVDGRWENLDTTPPVWFDVEQQNLSYWQLSSDFISWAKFVFTRWRWSEHDASLQKYLFILLGVLSLVLIWKLLFKKRAAIKRSVAVNDDISSQISRQGADSKFYDVMKQLNARFFARHAHESLSSWMERIIKTPHAGMDVNAFQELVYLHYRYRFDPQGLTPNEKNAFDRKIAAWMNSSGFSD